MKRKFFAFITLLFLLFASFPILAHATQSEQKTFTKLSDFKTAHFGAVAGTVSDKLTQAVIPEASNFSYFSSVATGVKALQDKKVDAFSCDEPLARLAVAKNEGLKIFEEHLLPDQYGYGFKKGNPLRNKFSALIEKFTADGTLEKLKAKWMGADDSIKLLIPQDWQGKNGTIRYFHDYTSEPMVYVSANGSVGYELDLMLHIAKALDMKVNFTKCEFAGLIAALQNDMADVISGCMSITEERKKTIDFATTHYKAALVLVVRDENFVAADKDFLESLQEKFHKTFILEQRWKFVLDGLLTTIIISAVSGVLGALLGFALCLLRREGSSPISKFVSSFIYLVKGTPIVLLLMILFYVVLAPLEVSALVTAIFGFTLNFGACAADIYDSGLNTIDKGQQEAALALGYTPKQAFTKVIFPQAAQRFLPSLKDEFVNMVKTTSVVGYITVQDLTMVSEIILSRTMEAFFPLITTAIIYLVIAYILTSGLTIVELKTDPKLRKRTIKGVKM